VHVGAAVLLVQEAGVDAGQPVEVPLAHDEASTRRQALGDAALERALHDPVQAGDDGAELDDVVQPRAGAVRREGHGAAVVAQDASLGDAVDDPLVGTASDDRLLERAAAVRRAAGGPSRRRRWCRRRAPAHRRAEQRPRFSCSDSQA
jgi:hypothetical protein